MRWLTYSLSLSEKSLLIMRLIRLASRSRSSSFKQLDIELYTDRKSPDTEQIIEDVLTEYQIFYKKSEIWIESERLYEVLYEVEV